mmetsp:Transcript_25367/g.27214  ORF Transcript_25367/g.27214 Transcript_25367/m.27214 type:complete len:124 (+) Transcript_25367:50-421(+)
MATTYTLFYFYRTACIDDKGNNDVVVVDDHDHKEYDDDDDGQENDEEEDDNDDNDDDDDDDEDSKFQNSSAQVRVLSVSSLAFYSTVTVGANPFHSPIFSCCKRRSRCKPKNGYNNDGNDNHQ